MTDSTLRNAASGSLELSAESSRPKITPAPVSHLRKLQEPSSGIDEEFRLQVQRIENKLDAILTFLKSTPK